MGIDPLKDGISSVELVNFMGNDLTVVNAARVSYSKESTVMDEKAAKLVKYLMKNKHGSPFEHVYFTFRVKAPLFVVQQWERHRMASYNEESGRYIQLSDEVYLPMSENGQRYRDAAAEDYSTYLSLLADGEPKERARMVLGTNLYKSFWFTVNSRSLMNFLMTRNDEHAQWEIRQYAIALEEIFTNVMPVTASTFVEFGRIAP